MKKKKIIFGWSAKCGCTHIKTIFLYLFDDIICYKDTHNTVFKYLKFPQNINDYTVIIIIRNPYKRLVSGFLDKYNCKYGQFRNLWKFDKLNFKLFVDRLICNDWENIDFHHFTPQTSEKFDISILDAKIFKCYDITNIDYDYIEKLYDKKIPEELKNFKGGHEKKLNQKYDDYVYNLDINEIFNYSVDTKYFYDKEIKEKIYEYYINDFSFFKTLGFNYSLDDSNYLPEKNINP